MATATAIAIKQAEETKRIADALEAIQAQQAEILERLKALEAANGDSKSTGKGSK